jgi:hypothetical protein
MVFNVRPEVPEGADDGEEPVVAAGALALPDELGVGPGAVDFATAVDFFLD